MRATDQEFKVIQCYIMSLNTAWVQEILSQDKQINKMQTELTYKVDKKHFTICYLAFRESN